MKKDDAYYDQVNLEDEFDLDNAEFQKAKKQRINIILPVKMINSAKMIAEESGVGYQNALKMAMTIGLKQLQDKINLCNAPS